MENTNQPQTSTSTKHNHYFKNVLGLTTIDVYRILDLYNVTDQTLGHAIKKLLVAGGRGHKDVDRDIQDCIDTLERWKQMRIEDKQRTNNVNSQNQTNRSSNPGS